MSSIATRTGDGGVTGLLGGRRVSKTDPRIEAIGTLDELSACLGCALAKGDSMVPPRAAAGRLPGRPLDADGRIWPPPGLKPSRPWRPSGSTIWTLWCGNWRRRGIVFRAWNLRGFSEAAAHLELARAVCRRAERRVWAVGEAFTAARPLVPRYLNRLSDVLWLLARRDLKEVRA